VVHRRDEPPGIGIPLRVPGWNRDERSRAGGPPGIQTGPTPYGRVGSGEALVGGGTAGVLTFPGRFLRPVEAQDFSRTGTVVGLTAAAGATVLAGSVFDTPVDSVAWIRSVGVLINGMATTTDVRWAVRQNGVPVQGWDDIRIMPRNAGSVGLSFLPEETFIEVPASRAIDIVVQVFDGGSYQLSGQYHGWWYSTSVERRLGG